tara:strand:+ start:125 stop:595 length:471 start_codon:yes stop_codon:yes gene_type:complete
MLFTELNMDQWGAQINLIERSAKTIIDAYANFANRFDYAVVFDIDDTLISVRSFGITPMINLYRYSLELGFFVVIVTARAEGPGSQDYTLRQLTEYGIPHPHLIYLRPPSEDPDIFKTAARLNVQNHHNKQVIMSLGDNKYDVGDYGGIGFLLPRL